MRSSTGGPYRQPHDWQLIDIREIRKFIRFIRESELLIVPLLFQGQHNLERGKGQYLYYVS